MQHSARGSHQQGRNRSECIQVSFAFSVSFPHAKNSSCGNAGTGAACGAASLPSGCSGPKSRGESQRPSLLVEARRERQCIQVSRMGM